jgi:hypothetical protein
MKINELSNDKLADYKKKASDDASAADKRGDYERGNKRFRGIVKATKKQFANDVKKHYDDKEQSVAEGSQEDSYSDKFVQSQIDYYMKHGLSGTAADRERINGSLNYYRHIKNKRIKDGTWQEQGVAEGWKDKAAAAALVGTALASNAGFDDAVKVGVDNANKSRQQVLAQYEKDKKDYEIHKANLDKVNAYIKKEGVSEGEIEENLDANQKRAGQLGPTEKVKNNNIGKLVGVSESIQEGEITEEMIAKRLRDELALFKKGQRKDSELSKKPRDREIQAKVTEISDQTIKNYAKGVEADSRKHKMDPTKRSAEKRNRSVSGFAKAMNRLDKKAK